VKIVYVTAMLPYGNGEPFLIPEIVELMRKGHEVRIVPVLPRAPVVHDDARALALCTASHSVISIEIVLGALLEFLRSPVRSLAALSLLLHSRTPRIFVKNLAVFAKGLWLSRYARKFGAEHVHAHWAGTSSTVAMIGSEVARIPWSFTAHRWDIVENNLLPIKVAKAAFVRTISRVGAREVTARANAGAKPCLLHLGVAIPDVRPSPGERKADCFLLHLLTAADFVEVKGHAYLLEALRILADRGCDIHLDLAGDGPLRPDVQQMIKEYDLTGRVTLLGRLSHDRLLTALATGTCDAVVLPSVVTEAGEEEGIPISLVEAMAARVPVVATNVGGIPELLSDDAGVLVPPRDALRLADVLERLALSPDLRRELADRGRARVESEYAIDGIVNELVARMAAS
jgi:colanic acid/amylovoran biosynthesis glycosyltransferase